MQHLTGQDEELGLYPKSTAMPLESFKLEAMFQAIVLKDHCGSSQSIRGI